MKETRKETKETEERKETKAAGAEELTPAALLRREIERVKEEIAKLEEDFRNRKIGLEDFLSSVSVKRNELTQLNMKLAELELNTEIIKSLEPVFKRYGLNVADYEIIVKKRGERVSRRKGAVVAKWRGREYSTYAQLYNDIVTAYPQFYTQTGAGFHAGRYIKSIMKYLPENDRPEFIIEPS